MVFRPDYLLALAVVVGLVHFQYRRVATVEERLFGRVKYEPPAADDEEHPLWPPRRGPGHRAFYHDRHFPERQRGRLHLAPGPPVDAHSPPVSVLLLRRRAAVPFPISCLAGLRSTSRR